MLLSRQFLRCFSVFALCLSVTGISFAKDMNGIDLKVTMKNMRLEFTKAMETTSSSEFNERIANIEKLLGKAQNYKFSPEHAKVSQEGLKKVAVIIGEMHSTATTDATLPAAKDKLKQVDNLRKQYHKKSKPHLAANFWLMRIS